MCLGQGWHTSLITALEAEAGGSLWVRSQPDLQNKFQDSQGCYTVKPCLEKHKTKTKTKHNSLCYMWQCSKDDRSGQATAPANSMNCEVWVQCKGLQGRSHTAQLLLRFTLLLCVCTCSHVSMPCHDKEQLEGVLFHHICHRHSTFTHWAISLALPWVCHSQGWSPDQLSLPWFLYG